MYVIAIIGQKGGTGKTMVAIALATQAAKAGFVVMLIDIDPQAKAANWKDRRKADDMVVEAIPAARLAQKLEAARNSGAEIVIIDSPGKNDSALMAAARAADLVLIPSQRHLVSLETLAAVRDLLNGAGNPQAFVLYNEIHPSATGSIADLKAGKTWEQAWTDCANTFYNEELTEGSKIAMSFLEAVGKIVSTVQGII